jgi:hypothetical protein
MSILLCVLIVVSSCAFCFPEMLIKVQIVKLFPVVATETVAFALEDWARLLVPQYHIFAFLCKFAALQF